VTFLKVKWASAIWNQAAGELAQKDGSLMAIEPLVAALLAAAAAAGCSAMFR
jgi:hypothetical protein